MDVPDDGTEATITVRAKMELDPDGVDTQLVPSPGACSRMDAIENVAVVGSVATGPPGTSTTSAESHQPPTPEMPGPLLPQLGFQDYEKVYDSWSRGELTLDEVVRQYGKDVSEMIQAQYVLGREVDAGAHGGTQLDEPDGVAMNEGDD